MKSFIYLLTLIALYSTNVLFAQSDSTLIKKVASMVSPDSALDNLERLTGEKETVIDGEAYVIKSRRDNHEGNHKAARFIYQMFSKYGYTPYIQHYQDNQYNDSIVMPGENVYAVSVGDENPDKYVVICAHYDCESDSAGYAPGADDNASGVTAVLEAARIFQDLKHKYTVIFACMDHEEFGAMGSSFFADSLHKAGIADLQCVSVDMIGFCIKEDVKTHVYYDTSHFSKPIADIIYQTGLLVNSYTNVVVSDTYAIYENYVRKNTFGMGDDIGFISKNYQAVTLCEPMKIEVHNPYYHTRNDRAKNFNLPYYFDNLRLCVAATASAAGAYEIKEVSENMKLNSTVMTIAPNPASRFVLIKNIELGSADKIEIYSQLGLKVLEACSSDQIIDISSLPSGVYIISTVGKSGKFIKL